MTYPCRSSFRRFGQSECVGEIINAGVERRNCVSGPTEDCKTKIEKNARENTTKIEEIKNHNHIFAGPGGPTKVVVSPEKKMNHKNILLLL